MDEAIKVYDEAICVTRTDTEVMNMMTCREAARAQKYVAEMKGREKNQQLAAVQLRRRFDLVNNLRLKDGLAAAADLMDASAATVAVFLIVLDRTVAAPTTTTPDQ
ncbi:hypothetical protein BASA81_018363 [Batrachochytrium salamandrivorans]|nr:hypothetical protein BASA81_018363 [Batrachochytrium salamandrivorans]